MLWFGRSYDFHRSQHERIAKSISRNGVAIVRNLIQPDRAAQMRQRFEENLARLEEVFPNYKGDANKNVFSLAMAFADTDDETLRARMSAAVASTDDKSEEFVAPHEVERFRQEVGTALLGGDLGKSLSSLSPTGALQLAPTRRNFARFECARPNSAYNFYVNHQDVLHEMHPDGLTVWLTLSKSGQNAPGLQFIPKRRRDFVPSQPENQLIAPGTLPDEDFKRPEYEPGDAVIFDAYLVHGTYITPSMPDARMSLDLRLWPLSQ